MTRLAFIHEETRYEVLIRGVRSRAEAVAIVAAVDALPVSEAWLPQDAPEPPTEDTLPPQATADPDDTTDGLNCTTQAVVP
jgi:hypothetical protein